MTPRPRPGTWHTEAPHWTLACSYCRKPMRGIAHEACETMLALAYGPETPTDFWWEDTDYLTVTWPSQEGA